MARFASSTYEGILVLLRGFLRGDEYNNTEFIDEMKTIDGIIAGLCHVIPDKFINKYI